MAKKAASKRKTREPKKILNSELPVIMTVKPDSRKNDAVTSPKGVDGVEPAAASLKDWGKTIHNDRNDRERSQRLSGCGTDGVLCDECVEKRHDARTILEVMSHTMDTMLDKKDWSHLKALSVDEHIRIVADLLSKCRDMRGRRHDS